MFFLLLATVLPAVFSCAKKPVEPAEPRIETGDLLFIGIPMNYWDDSMADAIADATAAEGDTVNFIHTAILEVDPEGTVWVIDATLAHGVDRHPLDTLLKDFALKDGSPETLLVMRLKDNGDAVRFVEQAKGFVGEEYDLYFKGGNGRHYCTATGISRTEREVSYYAERLNVSPKYLSATIKRVTGHSVTSYIDRHTVPILKDYLGDERLSLTQIAELMNFASLSYFSRYCTKHLGQSPSEYRQSLQPK